MTEPAPRLQPGELRVVSCCAALLALASLLYCYGHGLLLLYGDAVAHLHIARRLFDSATPGYRQLGSVWLPLSHLLLVPFVQKMSWWQSGLAGAWPSMACYVIACVALYRLARCWMGPASAALGTAFFALNPGLLYFATTAMTEPLFLAEMLGTAVLLVLFTRAAGEGGNTRRAGHLLVGCGVVLFCAVFTRYDGWIYAAAAWCVTAAVMLRRGKVREPLAGMWVLFTVVVAMAPLLWIAYNSKQFHDPLDFLRGPYSARAIEARTTPPGSYHYPGYHRMPVAVLYFLKAAELGAVVQHAANFLLWVTVAGTAVAVRRLRSLEVASALLLWVPLPFYMYSVAYGSVPIFIPLWFPHSWYNTRYGMEMLPAFALFAAFLVDAVLRRFPRWSAWIVSATVGLIFANTGALLWGRPLVYQEAVANSRTRIPFEHALAQAIEALPAGARILMYTSDHVGAVQQAGISLKQTINEGDYDAWRAALADPAAAAPYAIAIEGDAVAKAIAAHPEEMELLSVICSQGQPCARVYRSGKAASSTAVQHKEQ